jgi:hypothetical protein
MTIDRPFTITDIKFIADEEMTEGWDNTEELLNQVNKEFIGRTYWVEVESVDYVIDGDDVVNATIDDVPEWIASFEYVSYVIEPYYMAPVGEEGEGD